MPDARTHDLITLATGAAIGPLAYGYFSGPLARPHPDAMALTLWLVGAHVVSGVLFSPDLDLDSAIDDRWGILYWIWRPYMWMVPHRHFWSHSFIFAPLMRLGYFYLVVSLLLFGWVWLLARLGVVVPDYHIQLFHNLRALLGANTEITFFVLVGFCLGSAVHTIADWLVTSGRGVLRLFGVRIVRDYRSHDDAIHRRRRRRYA
ncbi:MAG: metal-binding protein [Chloroflexi bacterium OHK40]